VIVSVYPQHQAETSAASSQMRYRIGERRKVGRPILAAAGFLPGVPRSAPHAQEPPGKAAAGKIAYPTSAFIMCNATRLVFVGQVGNLPPIGKSAYRSSGNLSRFDNLLMPRTSRLIIGGRLPTCPTICKTNCVEAAVPAYAERFSRGGIPSLYSRRRCSSPYSYLSATMGSTRMARRAGGYEASSAMAKNNSETSAKKRPSTRLSP
jgi:hypothetical protein